MRFTRSLVPTLREVPADAEAVSHRLMLRAGLVRQLGAGIYVYLPLGQRVLDKINGILREEMNAIGGQEITMPVLHPAEIWRESGRWDAVGDEMFRLKDRHGRDLCLGMTHEEVVAWLAAREIRSYRDLPQIWYQIQTKERDEARPRSGVLRTREFLMKDSYTLDPDEASLERSYAAHEHAYRRIFDRCGLRYHVVQSDPGMMGGLGSHEFMAPSAAGEDEIALVRQCGYAANVELARGQTGRARVSGRGAARRSRHPTRAPSPRCRPARHRSAAHHQVAPLRGRRSRAPSSPSSAEITRCTSESWRAPLGEDVSSGASRAKCQEHPGRTRRAAWDRWGSAPRPRRRGAGRRAVTWSGANREGYHVRGVVPGRDFACRFVDLHTVARRGGVSAAVVAPWRSSGSSRSATSSSSGRRTRSRWAPCTWTSPARSNRS